uniref:TSA: Wollemia nobilis Ref_Wollemi_Transcript_13165_2535 transcribed RNA sequence n=1 Tax=Wollemia nobilis TaxID=56998 RepID=A0A0C9RKV3_9CONI
MCVYKICGRGRQRKEKEKAEEQTRSWVWMEGSIEEVLTVPIQLTERVREAVEEADSFKQECAEVGRQVERVASMLRSAARVASAGLYERPMRRIVQEVVKSLEKALALVRKCKRSGILKRVITITSATDFRRVGSQLESSIGDVNWLLNVCSGAGGGSMLSLPPIASTDPILSWVWGFIATVHNGTLEDKEEAANSLASLAADNDRNGKIIIEEGGVVPLLRLLKEGGSVAAQVAAATALGYLSTDQERVSQIVEEGAIPVVLGILHEAPMKVQARVAHALSRMVSHDPDAKEAFGQQNVIRPLVSLLGSDMDEPPAAGKNNLSIHSVVQLGIHRRTGNSATDHPRGTAAALRREREEEDLAVKSEWKTEVARALWKLAEKSESNSKRITDTKGLLCLAKLIQKDEGELQHNCLLAVMEITAAAERNSDLRRAAFKTNSPAAKAVVDQLLRVVEEEGKPHLQIPALTAIGCLARTFPARESRIIRPLVRQLGHMDPLVAAEAATALQKFAHPDNFLHTEHSKGIIESGGVAPLVRMLKLEEKAQVAALILLCYLAIHVGNSEALEQAKALSALELVSRTPISQSPSVKELLPKAIKHLELYQAGGGGHPHREMYEYP